MKQVLAMNYAVIEAEEIIILHHPTTIFTNDDVPVSVYDTEEEVNYHISQKSPTDFPPLPQVGGWCEINKVYSYNGKMVKCLQSHGRMSFAPELTPALFLIIEPTGTDYPVWVQPTGGHDAYNIGDKVHFPTITDPVYESLINANVWSPTTYPAGWRLV